MSPYFVMVGADGEVRSEGAASSWEQVRSLLADAIADEAIARAQIRRCVLVTATYLVPVVAVALAAAVRSTWSP